MDVTQGLKWVLSVDSAQMVGGLKQAAKMWRETGKESEDASKKIEKAGQGAATASAGIKKLGAAALAFVGFRQLIRFTKEAVNAGAEMERLRFTSDRVFGDMSLITQTWASELAGSYNIAEREAMVFTNRIGSMLKSMNFQDKQLTAMTLNLSKFAGELAYINNISTDQALSAVQSGLTGDGEALRRLGFNLSTLNIQEYMYAQGINESFKNLNARSQALVRHNYLMQQSTMLTGLAAETTNTWSGQTNLLSRQWDQLKTSVGEVITVAFTPLLKVVNMVVGWLVKATQAAMIFMRTLFGIAPKAVSGLSGLPAVAADLSSGFDDAASSAGKVRKEVQKLLGIDELNILPDDTTSGGSGASGLSGKGVDLDLGIDMAEFNKASGLTDEFRKKWEDMANTVLKYKTPILLGLTAIGIGLLALFNLPFVTALVKPFAGALVAILSVVGGWGLQLWGAMSPGLVTVVGKVGAALAPVGSLIMGALSPIIGWVGGLFSTIGGMFAGFGSTIAGFLSPIVTSVGNVLGPIVNVIIAPFQQIGGAVITAMGPLASLIALVAAVAGAFVQLWLTSEEFRTGIVEAVTGIMDIFSSLWTTVVQPVGESIIQMFKDIWDGGIKPVWDGWVDMIGDITVALLGFWNDHVQPFVKWFVEYFGPILSDIFSVFSNVVSLVMVSVGQYFGAAFQVIGSIVKGIIEVLGGVITFMTGVFTGDWRKAWDGVKTIFSGFGNMIKGIWEGIWTFITGLFSKGGKIFGGFVDGVANVFKSIVNVILDGINTVIAMPFQALRTMLGGIKSVNILGVKPFNFIDPYIIPVPQIPKFADGGMVFGETLGIMGEYVGARNNPEVIAPLDKLQSMIDKGESITPAQVNEMIRLLKLILEKDDGTYIDGTRVDDVLRRARNEISRRTGKVVG